MQNHSTSNPSLYSRAAIFVAALVLSPFFGALLFVQNLLAVEKGKKAIALLVFAGVWNFITFKVAWDFFLNNPLAYLVGNAVGGFILIFPMWRQHFSEMENYESKTVWSPLLVIIAIIAILMAIIRWF
jgi:hypothetical protein